MTKTLPVLYAYDKSNRVKTWEILPNNPEGGYTVIFGLKDGKKQSKVTLCKPKNVGKANETSSIVQADNEAFAKWTQQKDKNYHESLEDVQELMLPMLAQDFRKVSHRVNYPAHVLPKLDGVRCLVFKDAEDTVKFQSRGGKFYPVIKNIAIELEGVFEKYPDIILDGELYIHGEALEDIISAVKKHNNLTPAVEFCIFDCYLPSQPMMIWEERYKFYRNLDNYISRAKVYTLVANIITEESDVKSHHDQFVSLGYEGVMIRNLKGIYEFNNRSHNLQKYKEFFDEEFLVVGIEEADNSTGVPTCITKDGQTFKATYKATLEAKKGLLRCPEEYIGKQLTVKYQALTNKGVPSFPIGICFRVDT